MSDNDLIQKGQDDLIRRGDAREMLQQCGLMGNHPEDPLATMLNEIPAVQPTVSPELLATTNDVAALVKAVIMLNAACDAMWNDHERLEKNPDSFGQKYRLKETHLRAISEAQQNLPLALARVKGVM